MRRLSRAIIITLAAALGLSAVDSQACTNVLVTMRCFVRYLQS